jgi:Mg-chelatase subunit ChlD
MTEQSLQPLEQLPDPASLTPEEISTELQGAVDFLTGAAPQMGKIFGVNNLNVRICQLGEDSAGMASDPASGDLLIDPTFWFRAGYKSKDAVVYGVFHETAAHLRTIFNNPALNERIKAFEKKGKEHAVFNNIFEDVAGNNLIHAALPRMKDVAAQLYAERITPQDDFREIPRHMQFLYKILRQEMIPDSQTAVLPEVDAAIAELRDYQGQGDLIKYGTAVAKSAHQAMSATEHFEIWTNLIHPVYVKLIEQDLEDPTFENKPGESDDKGQPGEQSGNQGENQQEGKGQPGDNQSDQGEAGQDGENKPGDQSPIGSKPANGQAKSPAEQQFGNYYQAMEDSHLDPISEEDLQTMTDQAQERQAKVESKSPSRVLSEQERRLDEKVRRETGHSLHEQRRYDADIVHWQPTIQEMRDVFQQVISQRVSQKRGLSRRTFSEGAVLDPDRLVQTFIDVRNNVPDPEAFKDYESRRGETNTVGKTDYVFVLDVSGSMQGQKAQNAAASVVIGLEGLAAMQRDIEEAEASHNLDLDLDIRTAILTFGDNASVVKPLSTKVSPKERLDAYQAVTKPNASSTQDFLALEEIGTWSAEPDRRRIVIAVSDGGSNDGARDTSPRARRAIDALRGQGWFVYGISIGSNEAETLYSPTARRVDDPSKLPETIQSFIEATIS